MQITNKHNLPNALVEALTHSDYDLQPKPRVYSVSDLIQPTQLYHLKKRWWSNLTEDAIDNLWRMYGQITHQMLSRCHNEDGYDVRVEKRMVDRVLMEEFEDPYEIEVTGKPDRVLLCRDHAIVEDWKVTSAWSVVFAGKEGKPDWEKQLNCYAALVENYYQVPVKWLTVWAILRDWSESEAMRNENYPKKPIVEIPVKLWPAAKRLDYIYQRVYDLELYDCVEDQLLPECTPEDQWARPDKWAVMKEGRKSAVRLYENEAEAEERLEKEGKGFFLQHRPGIRTRCERYCAVSEYCWQHQAATAPLDD